MIKLFFKLFFMLIIGFQLFSCENVTQIEGVFINETKSEILELPVFFSFGKDSLYVKYHHIPEFIGFRLTYNSKNIIAQNNSDSLTLEIIPKKSTFSVKFQEPFTSKEFEIFPLNIGKSKIAAIDGYWYCNDSPKFDEVWLKIHDGDLFICGIDDGIVQTYEFKEGRAKRAVGKISYVNNNVYFDFNFPIPSTHIPEFIARDEIQIFSNNYLNRKYYSHFKKVKFNTLPEEIIEGIHNNEYIKDYSPTMEEEFLQEIIESAKDEEIDTINEGAILNFEEEEEYPATITPVL